MLRRKLLQVIPVFFLISILVFAVQNKFLPKTANQRPVSALTQPIPKPVQPPQPQKPTTPSPVRGIYCTSWVAGSHRIEELIDFIAKAKINTLVVDLKDDTGIISYPSEVPLAVEIGATSKRISNIKELIARLKKMNIYIIGRIVVFKDPLLARKHPEIAVKDKNGGIWRDKKGMNWVDPHHRMVWKYNLDIAKEAVAMGISEVQFDYVRFLSDGKISNCVYPFSKGERKEDVIHDFLSQAKQELNAVGAPVSADIFGLVLSVPDDLNIGQKLEKIASAVDYVSPMVYPSHYPKNSFNIKEPDLHPYEVINKAMEDAIKRVPDKTKFRPWLQDFSLGNKYERQQLMAQIQALNNHGIQDWLFWNPSNRYDLQRYNFTKNFVTN